VFICCECFEIRGSWKSHGEIFRQRCRCGEAKLPEPNEAWFGFDFNKLCELCYCCGAELVQSGFEASVWFCGECKERVEELNEASGRCVIPMGRFDSSDKVVIANLNSWMRLIVRDNLHACGFSETDQIALGIYLKTLAEGPMDKRAVFHQFAALFEVKAEDGKTSRDHNLL
jgi:hypothetical protein